MCVCLLYLLGEYFQGQFLVLLSMIWCESFESFQFDEGIGTDTEGSICTGSQG